METKVIKKIESPYLNVREAAEYLRVSARMLYNRCAPGAVSPLPIKVKRIGRRLLFDKRELDKFMDDQG